MINHSDCAPGLVLVSVVKLLWYDGMVCQQSLRGDNDVDTGRTLLRCRVLGFKLSKRALLLIFNEILITN